MAGVRRAVFEEDALIRQSLERMNDWALSVPGSGPRLLVVVGMVFDSEPTRFLPPFSRAPRPQPGTRCEGRTPRVSAGGSDSRGRVVSFWQVLAF